MWSRIPIILAVLALVACAGGSDGPPGGRRGPPPGAERGERGEGPPPPRIGRDRADPGLVAAADIALARTLRDEGEAAAIARFAAPGAPAVMFPPPGFVPRAVWSACDGSLAISTGRSESADGIVGSYVTVWQRERAGDYRFVYHLSAPDHPQPARRDPQAVPDGPDVILAEALGAIDGRAADCVVEPPLPPAPAIGQGAQHQITLAADGTLRWRWEAYPDGTRRVVVDWLRNGAWQEALAWATPAQAGAR